VIAQSPSGEQFSDTIAVRNYLLPGIWDRSDAKGKMLDLICNRDGGIDLIVDGKVHPVYNAMDLKTQWVGCFNPRVIEILNGTSHERL
jgi:hypothetical protein